MSRTEPILDVRRLSGSLGAEVRGLPLAKAGPGDADRLKALLLEHLVLFFPDQHLSPDEHIDRQVDQERAVSADKDLLREEQRGD